MESSSHPKLAHALLSKIIAFLLWKFGPFCRYLCSNFSLYTSFSSLDFLTLLRLLSLLGTVVFERSRCGQLHCVCILVLDLTALWMWMHQYQPNPPHHGIHVPRTLPHQCFAQTISFGGELWRRISSSYRVLPHDVAMAIGACVNHKRAERWWWLCWDGDCCHFTANCWEGTKTVRITF